MPQHTPSLDIVLESLLFAAGEPLSVERLAKITGRTPSDVRLALGELTRRLTHGITLVMNGSTAALAIAPGNEKVITEFLGDPSEREIGQAGLEVLAILLYQGPSTRATIDYIRGVNSSSSVRTLLIRDLIERERSDDAREVVYRPTIALLEYLGVTDGSTLPEATELSAALKEFIARQGAEPKAENNYGPESTTI